MGRQIWKHDFAHNWELLSVGWFFEFKYFYHEYNFHWGYWIIILSIKYYEYFMLMVIATCDKKMNIFALLSV